MEKTPNDRNSFERKLRLNSTDAERLLWGHLRSGRLQGFKFRRQYRFGRYVVDFYCPSKQLVIELDGGQHVVRQDFDQRRTDYLQSRQLEVIRFWNNDVLINVEIVLEVIWGRLMARVRKPSDRFENGSTLSPTLPLIQAEGVGKDASTV